jgi:molybdenum cofactor biosynthesis enzyme MoaA
MPPTKRHRDELPGDPAEGPLHGHLRALFAVAGGPALRSLEVARAGAPHLLARFADGRGAEVALRLHPPGSASPNLSSTPAADLVVPPDQPLDEARSALVAAVVEVFAADTAALSPEVWHSSCDGMSHQRFVAGGVAEIKLTPRCDQRCLFCKSPTTLANHVSVDEALSVLPELATETRLLTLSGGEPTLEPRLAEVVRAARRAGYRDVEIQSNGMTLADPRRVHALAEAGATSLLLSLHAHTAALSDELTACPGGFQRTLAGIDNGLRSGLAVTLCHVICAGNVEHLEAYARFVGERFAGWPLRLLFTLAIPTYRVRSQPGLMPSLVTVGEHLPAALRPFWPAQHWDHRSRLLRKVVAVHPLADRFARTTRRWSTRLLRHLPPRTAKPIHRASVIAHCGLPPCVLGDAAAYHDELVATEASHASSLLAHPEPCAPCVYRARCSGVWSAYLEQHGTAGITPVRSRSRV